MGADFLAMAATREAGSAPRLESPAASLSSSGQHTAGQGFYPLMQVGQAQRRSPATLLQSSGRLAPVQDSCPPAQAPRWQRSEDQPLNGHAGAYEERPVR